MRFKILAAVAALGVFVAGPCAADRAPLVITNPDWLVRPTGEDIARVYPKIAMAMSIQGRAVVACRVDSYGALEGCVVDAATPTGLGFGEAGMALTKKFRMKPKTIDGKPVEGGSVRIPMRFVLPPVRDPPAAPVSSGAGSASARRVVEALKVEARAQDSFAASMDRLDLITPGVDAATIAAAREAMAATRDPYVAALGEALASAYAANFTPAELDAIAAFLATPAGRKMAAGRTQIEKQMNGEAAAASVEMLRLARADFCRARNCDSTPTPADMREIDAAPVTVRTPEWSEAPNAEQMWAAYPGPAKVMGVSGWSALTCKVGSMGLLEDCSVLIERPKDQGFGAAALSLAGRFRLAPRMMVQGAAGESVAVTVRFPSMPRPEAAKPAPLAPSPALELARILARDDEARNSPMARSAFGPQMIASLGRAPAEVTAEASEAMQRAYDATLPMLLDSAARAYLDQYSESEMRALIAFRKSAAGKAWAARQPILNEALARATPPIVMEGAMAARKAFCSSRDCGS